MRFSTKVFLALAGLVCLSMAVALLVLENLTSRRLEQRFAEGFVRARAAFHELESLRLDFVAREIDGLARANPQLRTVLSTASLMPDLDLGLGTPEAGPDAALADANLRLRSLLPSLALAERSDALVVLSDAGQLLFSRADPRRAGDDLAALALYRDTLERGAADGVWVAPEAEGGPRLLPREPSPAAYRMLARPVLFEGAVHGVVLAGERIDAQTLVSLRAVSGLELALAAHGRLAATTLRGPAREELAQRLPELTAQEHTRRLELAGARYLARRAEIAPGVGIEQASFVLLSPLDAELAFLRRLRGSLIAAGAGVLAAALLPAFALARGITQRLAALARAARRVGEGDLDTRAAIAGSDEIGELGRAFDDMTRGLRERERIRRTFERYVSKQVAEEILRRPELAPLGGARRELTVGFVDLAGFTSFAERADPTVMVARLGEYFEAVCDAILASNGTVNEFLGDGVVAFWGAPVPQPDHAARAALAALRCRDALLALVQRWSGDGHPGAGFRIGLNTGELVVGEIGSAERRAYRAMGDAMNLASRIEGANKAYGTRLLASGATVARAAGAVAAREIDLVRVVGRSEPLALFELLAPAGALDPARAALAERYAAALVAWRAADFAGAERGFAACLALAPDDGPSRVLLARARALLAAPPGPGWEPIHVLDAK